jgi:hypothetical protein
MSTVARIACCLVLALAACGGDDASTCGVTDTSVSGVTLAASGETFGYDNFIWGQNNDCGVNSVTIRGGQVSPETSTAGIGLCIKQPGAVGTAAVSFADRTVIELVGATASAGDCSFGPAADASPIGTVTFTGFCTTVGTTYKVSFAAMVPGTKNCGPGNIEGTTLTLAGTALIHSQ